MPRRLRDARLDRPFQGLQARRLRRTWTDGRIAATGERLAAMIRSGWKKRPADPDPIEAPYYRGGRPCFYSIWDPPGDPQHRRRRRVWPSNLRIGGPPLRHPIRATHLEPGVTIVCHSQAQFDAEAARHGWTRYDPRREQAK